MKLTRRRMAALLASSILPSHAMAQLGTLPYSGAPSGAAPITGFSQMKIGAGGFVTGISIAPDGTRVVRCDTYGAYLWNASAASPGNAGGLGAWQPLLTTASIPSSLVIAANGSPLDSPTVNSGKGAYEIVVDPNNSQNLWMVFYGFVMRSTNKGATWVRITSVAQDIHAESNTGSGIRTAGPHIAVDPQNSDIVYVGNTTGVFVTTNGTAAAGSVVFTKIAAFATPGNNSSGDSGGALVAFDPNSSVVGGVKQGIYVSIYGTGVYHTTNGGGTGGTWTLTTGTPTNHNNMACAPNGTLYWVDDTGTAILIHKFTGSWSTVSTGATGGGNIYTAIDASGHIFVLDANGDLAISTNNGISFVGPTTHAIVATDIPWLAQNGATAPNNAMFGSAIAFDPSLTNTMVQAWGLGVAVCNPPTTATAFNWTSQSAGIEQLVTIRIVSPPNGFPVLSCWDRVGFTSQDPTKYPSLQNAFYDSTILSDGWGLDWASSAPASVVTYSNQMFGNNNASGASSDKGVTWTVLGSTSYNAGEGGCLAASTPTFFIIQSGNNAPQYTTNGGASWTLCPGVPANGGYQTSVTTFWPQLLAADRVDPNTFYLFADTTGTTGDVYKSTTNPPSFSKVHSALDTYDFKIPLLASVPNLGSLSTSGHLFFSIGKGSGLPFRYSIDHGTTWTVVTNITEVWGFDFGVPAAGKTYPAIYVYGFKSTVWGLWRCIDAGDNISNPALWTWTNLITYALNSFDTITNVCADANTFGVVYVGYQGSGAARGVFS